LLFYFLHFFISIFILTFVCEIPFEEKWRESGCVGLMWVRSLSAKFLTCRFALVEYQTIKIGARDGSDENKKKREKNKRARFMHQDIQSNPLTWHESGNITSASKTFCVSIHARYILRAPLSTRENACGSAARCDLRVVGYYRRVSGDEWKSTLGTRNNTRFAHLECILPVCSTVWFVRGILWCNKRFTETSSGLLECEENILTYTGHAGCNRPRFLIIDRADALQNT